MHATSGSLCHHARACRYSEEEVKALHQPPEEQLQQGGAAPAPLQQAPPPAAAAPAPAVRAPVDPAALKKQLMQLIPKDKAGVFAYQINWGVLDSAPAAVRDKISGGCAWGAGW